MSERERFLSEHEKLTHAFSCTARRASPPRAAWRSPPRAPLAPELAKAVDKIGPYFTPQEDFQDVSRGKPVPHSLPDEKKREVGLTRESWKLEVVSDPTHPAALKPLTRAEEDCSTSPASCGLPKNTPFALPR